jgi:protein-tyrosine phosphatase
MVLDEPHAPRDRYGREGRLVIMARPRGGDWLGEELQALRRQGFDIVVSALTPPEQEEFELEHEAAAATEAGFDFVSIPIPDMGIPVNARSAGERLAELAGSLSQRRNVAMHCRMSIGRSSLIAASILVLMGSDPAEVFRRIGAARGMDVPETETQRRWVEELAGQVRTRLG